MRSLLKMGKIKLIGFIAIVPLFIVGTVFAYNVALPSKAINENTQAEIEVRADKASRQANDNSLEDTVPTEGTASESTATSASQPQAQTPTATTQTTTQTDITPQQTTTAPEPVTQTCDESMRSSYINLYNSQVASENASWNNQITAWNNYASSHGMSFSGYVQDQINQNKPAHDARLALLQTQYYQNLSSINCNP